MRAMKKCVMKFGFALSFDGTDGGKTTDLAGSISRVGKTAGSGPRQQRKEKLTFARTER